MSKFDENLFERIALLSGFVTKEQLGECAEAREKGAGQHVGEILLGKGYLTQAQFDRISEIRNKKARKLLRSQEEFKENDREFARHVISERLIQLEDLEGAVLEQQRLRQRNLHFNIAEVLFSRSVITLSGIKRVMAVQGTNMLRCSLCDFQFRIAEFADGSRYQCPQCKSELDPPVYLDPLMVEGVVESTTCSTIDG